MGSISSAYLSARASDVMARYAQEQHEIMKAQEANAMHDIRQAEIEAKYKAEIAALMGQLEAANARADNWHRAADARAAELTRLGRELEASKLSVSHYLERLCDAHSRLAQANTRIAQLERGFSLRKLIKGIILAPLWPLIWLQVGFSLDKDCSKNECEACGKGGCCTNAKRMVAWFRR